MVKDIAFYRDEINRIDLELLRLLNQRAECAQEIGSLKEEINSPVFHPEREKEVIKRLLEENRGPLFDSSVEYIWQEIMSACRALEQTLSIAFLGPEGTFSEEAAHAYFGSTTDFLPYNSIDSVFKAVSNQTCRFGVVPVENTIEGSIGRSLDLLQQSTLKVVGELVLRIEHHLLSRDAGLKELKVIYGHPQALAQCQGWLQENLPDVEQKAVSSNAEGARLAAENKNTAAIAGRRAASIYGLQYLAKGIQDSIQNQTRFVVIARHDELQAPLADGEASCTSVVAAVSNRPGALYDLLEPFKRHQVMLTKMASRPTKIQQWEYFFYMDIAGHSGQPEVAAALQEIKEMSTFYKVLGSYTVRQRDGEND